MAINRPSNQPSWSEEYLRGIVKATTGKVDVQEICDFAYSLQEEFAGYTFPEAKPEDITSLIFENEALPFFQGFIEGLSGERLKSIQDLFNDAAYKSFEELLKEEVRFKGLFQSVNFFIVQMQGNSIIRFPFLVPQYTIENYLYEDFGYPSDIYWD